ncbi:MAG: DUF6171 family protein [Treponema sp.]|nr:DUF6171 family protein [Treponema sp.]
MEQIPISPSLRTDGDVYKRRISICGLCEDLGDGIVCLHCGCFVLFRARSKDAYCPHPSGNRWI